MGISEGKVAIVTGSSRGIGRKVAIALAEQCSGVIVNYLQNKEMADETIEEIRRLGRSSFALKADIRSETQVNGMVGEALKSIGGLVVFLCSDDSYYITGQTININGGLYM